MAIANGYLLLADITGYTSFLASTPTEIGARVSASLLETLLDRVFPPFKIANIEGDAVFIYAPDDGTASSQTVLDAIDSLYCAFTDRVCALRYGAGCPDDPSLLAGALDLKLVVHYGEYAVSRLRDHDELSGSAVILLHRLAKNTVTRDTGHTGYAMLTVPAVEHMGLSAFFEGLESHREEVDHLGSIDTYVYPLAPVWERRRRGVRHFVERTESLLVEELTIDLPVPPCRAWELCTEPQYRAHWISGVQRITLENLEKGRTGIGTVHQCDHGDGLVVPLTVTDWRPFDYISFDILTPVGLTVSQTIELQPIGSGTRIVIRVANPKVGGFLSRWRARGSIGKLRQIFQELYANAHASLARLAQASGQPAAA
jgi:uncharacterized protein YndB with AHSA1/START domain